MINLGEGIKYYRQKRDLSHQELASASGLSQSSISMYENNKRTPSDERLEKIARALDVTIEGIYAKSTEEYGKPQAPKDESSFYNEGLRRERPSRYYYKKEPRDRYRGRADVILQLSDRYTGLVNIRVMDELNRKRIGNITRGRSGSPLSDIFEKVIVELFAEMTDEINDRVKYEIEMLNYDIDEYFEQYED